MEFVNKHLFIISLNFVNLKKDVGNFEAVYEFIQASESTIFLNNLKRDISQVWKKYHQDYLSEISMLESEQFGAKKKTLLNILQIDIDFLVEINQHSETVIGLKEEEIAEQEELLKNLIFKKEEIE